MAQRTQIRMGALSGTFGIVDGAISDQEAAIATGSIVADGLDDILSHMASSVKRLHGHTSFSANAAGTFYTDVLPSADDTLDLGSASAAWQDLHLEGDVLMTDAGKVSTAAGDLEIESAAGSVNINAAEAAADAIVMHAENASGGIDMSVNSTVVVSVDANSVDIAQPVNVDATTESTSTSSGALIVDGGVGIAKDLYVGDDLLVKSNSAVVTLGDDQAFTITHANSSNTATVTSGHKLAFGDAGDYISGDGTDLLLVGSADVKVTGDLVPSADDTYDLGTSSLAWQDLHMEGDVLMTDAGKVSTAAGDMTIESAAAGVTLDAATTVKIDSDSGDISFEDGGVAQLAIDMDGTAGEIIIQPKVASDDLVFKTQGGAEALRIEDDAAVDFGGGAGSSGVTITAAGQITADGRILVDDATDATSTTDGSLQTDGGLSVAKDVIVGNDAYLLSDSAVLGLGAGKDVNLTHDGSTGATLSAAGKMDVTAGAASVIKATVGALTLKAEQNHADGKVVLSGSSGADSVHIQSDATVGGALVVSGDLTVNGTTTTVASTVATIADPLIVLGQGNSTDTKDLGLVFVRSSNNMWMGFDESDDYFKVADVGSEDGTTSGNISSVTPTNMMVGKLAVDSSANYLDVTSSDLTATAGQDFVVDAARDVILDAAGNDVMFKANGTQFLKLTNNSGDVEIFNGVADKDILFKDLAGNEVFRMDGSAESLLMASSKRLQLGAAEEALYGDGTDIHFEVGANGDINIPADIGLTFGDDGERIEGDGTDLSVYGNIINLIPTTDVVLPNDKGIVFGGAGEKIEGDGSKLVIAAANLDLTLEAGGDVVLPQNIGMVFGDAAEKIEGNGSKLTIASSDAIDLTATTDVVLPSNVGMVFGDNGEKIEGNGQRLAIQSGVGMHLDAEGTIIIDSDNGIVTFEDGGVNHGAIAMTGGAYVIAANKTMVLSSSQGVVEYNDDGVSYLRILKSGNDTIISSSIDNGDIKFHADDDTEVFKIDGAEKAAIFGSGRKLCFADTGEFIEGNGTNLSIGSGGEIQLLAGTDITFDANGGDFVFADDSSVGMSIDIDAAAGDALFLDAGGAEIFRIDGSANSLLMAGTNRIDFNDDGTMINSAVNGSLNINADGTAVDAIDLRAASGGVKLDAGLDGSAVAIHLDSASGVTIAGGDQNDSVYFENSPIQLEAISAPSSTTGKLYNIGGALYWNGNAISDTSQKQVFKLAAAVNAGTNISGDANATTFNVSNIVTADHLKKVDVFVNGQMMVSGSEAERAASTADYHMIGTRAGGNDNAVELQFGFGLEPDDVVQVSVK